MKIVKRMKKKFLSNFQIVCNKEAVGNFIGSIFLTLAICGFISLVFWISGASFIKNITTFIIFFLMGFSVSFFVFFVEDR